MKVMMEPSTQDAIRGKQVRVLATLLLMLCAIFFSPTIRVGIEELLPRPPVRLGVAEFSVPKTWRLARTAEKVIVWKPCYTILCGSSQRYFDLQSKELPEQVWVDAAKEVLHKNFSEEVITKTIAGASGGVTCVELNSPVEDDRVVSSCINAEVHLTSTFTGKLSLKPVFYTVLASARRAP
jgi:hypothetical protein